MKKIIILLVLFCTVFGVRSQVPDVLRQKLVGKTKLTEIMKEVEEFYKDDKDARRLTSNNKEEEFENDYLRWKRWEYYQASRLDENGNVVPNLNRKMNDGWKTYQDSRLNTNSPLTSYSIWNAFGPTGITRYGAGYNSGYGRVNCLAFHPTLSGYLLAGTPQGGIWKTTNNGTSWVSLTDNLPSNGIGGLVWDRTNSNVIYALTGDGDASGGGFVSGYGYNIASLGVYKSVDGGNTWDTTGTFPGVVGNFYGFKMIQHPTNANTLFAATSNGIYETTNGGVSWVQQQIGSFTDIEFKPGDPTIMYAAQKGSAAPFWRSTNSGVSWTNAGFTGVPTTSSRIAIGVSANQPNYIYILAGGATGFGSFVGVYRSTTAGTPNFSLQSNTPNILGYPNDGSDNKSQAGYDLAIEVDPANANTIITGGINIWKSTDGGSTWGGTSRTQWYDNALTVDYVHPDMHNLAYNPTNGYFYSTSDGGVGYSSNTGTNWTFISPNLQILATYHADWYEANQEIIGCGAQDNGEDIRYTASNTYRHIYGADGFDCVIKDNDISTIVYVANGELHKTTDGGSTQANVSPGGLGTFPHLARDFNTNTRIFAGDGGAVYRSTDFGGTWSTFGAGISGRVLTTCPSNSDRLYTSDGTTLQRSDNATSTLSFTTVSGTTGYPTGVNLTDIDVWPSNSLFVYGSFGGYQSGKKVYSSTDGGATWANISGSLPNVACHSIVVDASQTVYVGTDVGVFVRSTAMTDWQPFYNYLPRTPVSELMVNNTTGRIIACTFGRGNFYTDLYSTCPTDLNIVGNYSGTSFFEASNSVVSSATVNQGAGNTMALKAGSFVRMDPGAEIKNNSQFRAYIAPCNTGGVPLVVQNLDATINTQRMYVPARNGVRFADGKFSSVLPGKNGAVLEIISAGNYSARIVDKNGSLVKHLFTNQIKQPGIGTLAFSMAGSEPGLYYLQLFKNKELVHFHEFDLR